MIIKSKISKQSILYALKKDIDYSVFCKNDFSDYIRFKANYSKKFFDIEKYRNTPKKYSILIYNLNNYETFTEPDLIDYECEYIYVTDDKTIKSNIYKIIYIEPDYDDIFKTCYSIRFNLFNYATTPVCIYIDASVKIFRSLKPLYNMFMQQNYDIGLLIHKRFNFVDEYMTWINTRNYNPEIAQKNILYFINNNYDLNYKGLYEGTLRIVKNTELNKKIDTMCYSLIKELGTNNKVERIDQIIYSYILNKYFNYISVLPLSNSILTSSFMHKQFHASNTFCPKFELEDSYLFNKKCLLKTIE